MREVFLAVMQPGPAATRLGRIGRTVVFIAGIVLSAAIVLRFYDRTWVAGDDGYYAHIAERILGGEVLHRDVQAMHPGYVYFVDALALRLFPNELVSLRYPIVALGIVQAALVGALFLRHSAVMAATAAVLFTSLSYVLFPTPSVHWYCLFLFVVIVCAMEWVPRDSGWRPFVLGFLVVLLGLFRQLSGAFVGAGVVAYLLAEPPPRLDTGEGSGSARPAGIARWVAGAMAILVAAYTLTKGSPLARVLFGIWVPAVAAIAAFRAERASRDVLRQLLLLGAGGMLAAAPMFAYHLATHSLADWFNDSVVSAVALSELEYVQVRRYGEMLAKAARQIVLLERLRHVLNGAFWVALMLAPAVLGLAVVRALARTRQSGRWPHPLPFLAVFYAPVAIHYEAPAYVFFAAGPVMVGLLWLLAERATLQRSSGAVATGTAGDGAGWARLRPQAVSFAAVLCAGLVSYVALRYQAAQPVERGHLAVVGGFRNALAYPEGIDRLGLQLTSDDAAAHSEVLELIRRHTAPGDAILSVPGGAEFYYLSGRRNPLPYPYVIYGVMDDRSLEQALETLRHDPPTLIIYMPTAAYNTPYTDRMMRTLLAQSTLLARVRQIHVYKLNPRATTGESAKESHRPDLSDLILMM